MALVRSALEVGPYAIGDDEEGEEHGDIPGTPSLATSDEAIDELQRLDHAHSASRLVQQPVSRTAPGQTISREMAYRVMRDAVALQLARRGFDGLRGTALWLVAELAADFTRALGYQLAQVAVPTRTRTLILTRTRTRARARTRTRWPCPPRTRTRRCCRLSGGYSGTRCSPRPPSGRLTRTLALALALALTLTLTLEHKLGIR